MLRGIYLKKFLLLLCDLRNRLEGIPILFVTIIRWRTGRLKLWLRWVFYDPKTNTSHKLIDLWFYVLALGYYTVFSFYIIFLSLFCCSVSNVRKCNLNTMFEFWIFFSFFFFSQTLYVWKISLLSHRYCFTIVAKN